MGGVKTGTTKRSQGLQRNTEIEKVAGTHARRLRKGTKRNQVKVAAMLDEKKGKGYQTRGNRANR